MKSLFLHAIFSSGFLLWLHAGSFVRYQPASTSFIVFKAEVDLLQKVCLAPLKFVWQSTGLLLVNPTKFIQRLRVGTKPSFCLTCCACKSGKRHKEVDLFVK